jgi:hypothetical protein
MKPHKQKKLKSKQQKINYNESSSRKHLLITLLRLEFVVLVLYFYLCGEYIAHETPLCRDPRPSSY